MNIDLNDPKCNPKALFRSFKKRMKTENVNMKVRLVAGDFTEVQWKEEYQIIHWLQKL